MGFGRRQERLNNDLRACMKSNDAQGWCSGDVRECYGICSEEIWGIFGGIREKFGSVSEMFEKIGLMG